LRVLLVKTQFLEHAADVSRAVGTGDAVADAA
jgi:hypothetical protein